MFQGIEHIAVASPDPGALAQWYVDHLGFRIIHKVDGGFFGNAPNGSFLEIVRSADSAPPQKMEDNRRAGIRHFAIAVDDFDSAHAALRSRDVRFLTDVYVHAGNRLIFFNDGDGNLCHLIQRGTPLP